MAKELVLSGNLYSCIYQDQVLNAHFIKFGSCQNFSTIYCDCIFKNFHDVPLYIILS